jgi:hypothetical protein
MDWRAKGERIEEYDINSKKSESGQKNGNINKGKNQE